MPIFVVLLMSPLSRRLLKFQQATMAMKRLVDGKIVS